jgi:hypothetical protein
VHFGVPWKSEALSKAGEAVGKLVGHFLLGFLLDPEDGGSMFLRTTWP